MNFFKYFLIFILITNVTNCSKIQSKEVTYQAGDTPLKGYIAWDDSVKGPRPGVIVVHEWWGHNDYSRKRADMLARLGYTAIALDMYGNGKTANHPKDASGFSSEISSNMPLAKERFLAAYNLLKTEPTVDNRKIAAIGYCFGGGIVLNMARLGVDLKGVASFHGSLKTANPAKPGDLKAKILVLNGEDDPMVTSDQIEIFKKEMNEAGADLKFISYPGAKHAFSNPEATAFGEKFNIPLAYNKDADEKSWNELKIFLIGIFK